VGVGLCIAAALSTLLGQGAFVKWRVPLLAAGVGLVAMSCLAVLLSPEPYYNLHGFLLAAPFVALALWPNGEGLGPRFLYGLTLAYIGLHVLIISAFSGLGPISVHEWGQRYLLPAYPLLVVLALLTLGHIADKSRAPRQTAPGAVVIALAALLALVGVGFTVRGYGVLSEEREQVTSWLSLVRTLPQREPLVTNVWWLPLNLAADFYSRPMMLAEGDERLAAWAAQMHERGVTHFGLATDDPQTLEGPWVNRVGGLSAEGPPSEERGIWLQRYTLRP
jgi:hypothetical protein